MGASAPGLNSPDFGSVKRLSSRESLRRELAQYLPAHDLHDDGVVIGGHANPASVFPVRGVTCLNFSSLNKESLFQFCPSLGRDADVVAVNPLWLV